MKKQADNNSIRKVVLYIFIVLCLIAFSFGVKFISLIKQSTYTTERRYTVGITEAGGTRKIISIDESNATAAMVTLLQADTRQSTQQLAGIPLDAEVVTAEKLPAMPAQIFLHLLKQPKRLYNMTNIDMTRLFFFTKSLKDIQRKEFSHKNTSQLALDSVVTQLFADTKLIDDGKTIEIINATDIGGFGARLERLLVNAGANVISVRSSQSPQEASMIYYYHETSYTLQRVEEILKFPLKKQTQQGIADIQIVLGNNSVKTVKF